MEAEGKGRYALPLALSLFVGKCVLHMCSSRYCLIFLHKHSCNYRLGKSACMDEMSIPACVSGMI